jgi:hypothetical protein
MLDDVIGTIEYASFGKDRKMCGEAQKLADVAYEAIISHLSR